MLQGENIVEILRKIQIVGEVELEDNESIDLQLKIGTGSLKAWAFIFTNAGIVFQIYCIESIKSTLFEETLRLLNELNHKLPFGNYQLSQHGVVTYRAQCFADSTEKADFSIRTALEWAKNSIEEHIPGITAVSSGFTTAESALRLMETNSPADIPGETEVGTVDPL